MAGVIVEQGGGRPGQTADITIRGQGSITAGSSPLYVIDGVIAGAGASEAVSPSDIETITVLKDAAATALYGSRASSGVVVITTKSGSAGDTQVNFRTSRGYNTTLHGNESWMDAQELYDFHQSMQQAELGPFYNRSEVANTNTNWRDIGFDTGVTQMFDASVSGGNEQTRFYISGNYFDEEGTNIGTEYQRISGRVSLEHDVSQNFQVTARAAGHFGVRDNVVQGNPYTILTFSQRALPWDSPWNDDGTVRVGTESDWYSRDSENPLHGMQWNTDLNKNSYYEANLNLRYDFLDWAYVTSSNRYTQDNGRQEIYLDSRTQAGGARDGSIEHDLNQSRSLLTSNLVNVRPYFGEVHSVSGLVGIEYQDNRFEYSNLVGGSLAPELSIPSAAAVPYEVAGNIGESAFLSYLAQGEYEFSDRYIVTASFRRDGSSRFGSDNRYGNFYSVGASWSISNESFMESVDAISQLALRASYGTTGNASIENYEALGLYSYTSNYIGAPASFPTRVSNPNLTWETAKTVNVGLDAELAERVNMSIDVYQRDNVDLLQAVTLPGTSGIESRIQNVGHIRNRGIELQLTSTNIEGDNFLWTTDLTFSSNRNKVVGLYDGEPIATDGDQRLMEGHDMNTYWLRKWHGVNRETGAPQWEVVTRNEAGEITDVDITEDYGEANPQVAGASTPNFMGGMRNTFRLGHFSLSAFFTFMQGATGYYATGIDFGAYMTTNYRHLRPGESYWKEPGDDAHFPANIAGGNNSGHLESSLFLYDRSYLRLRTARISYNIPVENGLLSRLRSAQVYINGENLITFSNWPGRDPASDDNSYPLARNILFGIELGL